MKRGAFILVLTLLPGAIPAIAPPAGAAQLTVESRSYLPAREDGSSDRHVGIYEYLSFGLEDLLTPGLFIQAGGWGRADIADETYERKTNAEFQYGYLGYRAPRRNTELRLGRLSVSGGTARGEVIDGLQLRTDLGAGFDALAFAGVPVEYAEGGRSGDQVYGGRLSQGMPGIYRIGASYLKEQEDSEDAREEAGLDLFGAAHLLRPRIAVTLSGTSRYNMTTDEFAQHDYRVVLGPLFSVVRITGSYGWVDYGNFFTTPIARPFAPPALDPDEQLRTIGGELEFLLPAGLSIAGDYTDYAYDIMEPADAYGVRLDWRSGALTAGLAAHWSEGDEPTLQYAAYSAYGTAAYDGLRLALSVQEIIYEEEISDVKNATTATLGAEYALGEAIAIGGDVSYGVNPHYDREVTGMLKLTYRYASAAAKGGSGK